MTLAEKPPSALNAPL